MCGESLRGFPENPNFLLLLPASLIKLLESPIPAAAAARAAPAPPSQKAHCDNISGTKRGTIDLLVSKRPEKNSE